MLVQGVASNKNALGYFGYAYYAENKDKLKAVPIVEQQGQGRSVPSSRSVERRHLPAAVAPDVHLCRRQGGAAARSEGVRRVLPDDGADLVEGSEATCRCRRRRTSWRCSTSTTASSAPCSAACPKSGITIDELLAREGKL